MLPYNEKLKDRSRELRKGATKEERHLWFDFLKSYPVQFNRQKVIGSFIIDFYCDKAKLAIELDGQQHYENEAILYDEERTAYLNSLGIDVIRITNFDVNKWFNEVCAMLNDSIKARIDPHQAPSAPASPRGSLNEGIDP